MWGALALVSCGAPAPPPLIDATATTTTSESSSSASSSSAADETAGDSEDETGGSTGQPYACEPKASSPPPTGFFTDISEQSGIQKGNFAAQPAPGTAINDHSRLAFADIDGDGFDDVVMHSLFPNPQGGVPFEHLVFHNNGDGTFADVSDASGLRDVQAAFFAFADVDNDGDQDLFAGLDLLGYGDHQSAIYLNDGAGMFSRLPQSGVATGADTAANATFADFDGDGKVDLFVGFGGTTYAVADRVYVGHGDGTFTESTASLQGPQHLQPSNGSITCDYDDDLDLDIFVSTYSVSTSLGHNRLWEADGTGVFTEVAAARGFAAQLTGNYWMSVTEFGAAAEPGATPETAVGSNGFGIDCGDIDNDGDLDILATAISHPTSGDYDRTWSDPSLLLVNGGAETGFAFTNTWLQAGLPFNEGDVDGALVDFDNDGRLDISLSRENKYEEAYAEQEQAGWFGLAWQREDGTFESVGLRSGLNDDTADWGRMKRAQNHAWSDIDHDGDLDLLVGGRDLGGGRPNFLFRNDLGQDGRWLAVRLQGDGVHVNKDAFGARVTLRSAEGQLLREKKSSRGMYNSEDTRVLHFGLGEFSCDYEITVRWPDGTTVSFDAAEVGENRFVDLRYPDVRD